MAGAGFERTAASNARGPRRRPAMLATYAGVAFGYLPGIADRVYPWDLPALAFFVLFGCLLVRRRIERFLFALPVGVLFKETVGILCLAYRFVDGSRSRRRPHPCRAGERGPAARLRHADALA